MAVREVGEAIRNARWDEVVRLVERANFQVDPGHLGFYLTALWHVRGSEAAFAALAATKGSSPGNQSILMAEIELLLLEQKSGPEIESLIETLQPLESRLEYSAELEARRGNPRAAVRSLMHALEGLNHPDRERLIYTAISICEDHGLVDEAVSLARVELERAESFTSMWAAGCAELMAGRPHRAFDLLMEAKSRRPESVAVQRALAGCYYSQKEYEKAIEIYELLVDRTPHEQMLRHRLMATYVRARRWHNAEEAALRDLEIERTEAAYRVLAHSRIRQHDLRGYWRACREFIKWNARSHG